MNLIPTKPEGTINTIFDIDCVSDSSARQRHIDSAARRDIPRCTFRARRKGKVAVVASGPSVAHYVDLLKEWDGEIWGINGAFGWMLHRGIKPTAFVGIDPEEILVDYLKEPTVPPKDATYYLAAQVHPAVFDHLKDHNVRLWFQADGEVKLPVGVNTVPGGSTCLGRAPYLAYMLGWEDIHIFGGDSSFTHKTHVYGGTPPEKDHGLVLSEVGGVVYKTQRNMIAQATELAEIASNFPGTITFYGDGLMQALVEDVKKSGIVETLAEEEALRGMNRKQRRALAKMK